MSNTKQTVKQQQGFRQWWNRPKGGRPAAAAAEKRPMAEALGATLPGRTVALGDLPAVLEECQRWLGARGISRVHVHFMVSLPGAPIQLDIRYFHALDLIGGAKLIGRGRDENGLYEDYAAEIGSVAIIRWRKLGPV